MIKLKKILLICILLLLIGCKQETRDSFLFHRNGSLEFKEFPAYEDFVLYEEENGIIIYDGENNWITTNLTDICIFDSIIIIGCEFEEDS